MLAVFCKELIVSALGDYRVSILNYLYYDKLVIFNGLRITLRFGLRDF